MAKIFISHSSNDKGIVDLFKDLILNAGLGVLDRDIAYTSAPETGVPTGGNIPQYIKDNIADSDFVFFMISEYFPFNSLPVFTRADNQGYSRLSRRFTEIVVKITTMNSKSNHHTYPSDK